MPEMTCRPRTLSQWLDRCIVSYRLKHQDPSYLRKLGYKLA
jgi:hypothetical protein